MTKRRLEMKKGMVLILLVLMIFGLAIATFAAEPEHLGTRTIGAASGYATIIEL